MQAPNRAYVCGYIKPGFEAVREAFVENFTRRGELGAACCIYYRGEKVVDLWGGIRNKVTGEPWEEGTMALVFSSTKGLSAMCLALAHSRGRLDYDERVCAYWPEFARAGKDQISVRRLLAHQAGLFALDETVDREVVVDLDRLAVVLAKQKPEWAAGERQAYHAQSLGFYEGELLRRIDPQHRSLGQFFQEEIALPLGLDFYIRLPESVPNARLAVIRKANILRMMQSNMRSLPILVDFMNRNSPMQRAVFRNPGPWLSLDPQTIYVRSLEVPSSGGVGTARAIAKAYSVFARGAQELGLRSETFQAIMAPPIPSRHGFSDAVTKREMAFSLGFMKHTRNYPFGSPSAFGSPGNGGSFGFGDPQGRIGFAYVPNQMGAKMGGDPRCLALQQAFKQVVASRRKNN